MSVAIHCTIGEQDALVALFEATKVSRSLEFLNKRKMFQPKSAAEAAEKVREAIARNPSPDVTPAFAEEGIRRRPEG